MSDVINNTNTSTAFLEEAGGGLQFFSRRQGAVAAADIPFFKTKAGMSKSTQRVYRAAWVQLAAYCSLRNVKPLEITYAQMQEFLAAPGPMQRERICAIRAVFAAHGVPVPEAPVNRAQVAARIGELVLTLAQDIKESAVAVMSDEELIAFVRQIVAKKKEKKVG